MTCFGFRECLHAVLICILRIQKLKSLSNSHTSLNDLEESETRPVVFMNHSKERSLSYSQDFFLCLEAFIYNTTSDWLNRIKPNGLTNQKSCYIPICKSWRKSQRMFLRMVGE